MPVNWIFSRHATEEDREDAKKYEGTIITDKHYLTSVQDDSIPIATTDTTTGGATNRKENLENLV